MRIKKSFLNASIGVGLYIVSFFPVFLGRKIFLDQMGAELLGLTSLYTNILSYLSIVELGIGAAIIYSLYEPFANKDNIKVKMYLDYYKKFYFKVGIIVSALGIIIVNFIPFLVKNNISIDIIKRGFILFLINTVVGYFFTYKHCLLNVAQESYKISIYMTLSKLLINIFQIIIVLK
ncbi:MAG: O-unit flippase, partial [Sarcina sp.]